MSFVYVASPYSSSNKEVQADRAAQALDYVSQRSMKGEVVFSPIVHSHPMTTYHGVRGDWGFWSKIDYAFIDSCSKLRVLMLNGWTDSVGVMAEIRYAIKTGKEVEYVEYKRSTTGS